MVGKKVKNNLLSAKFVKEVNYDKTLTTLHNYSLFVFGSSYNTAKYFKSIYKTKFSYGLLNIRFKNETQTFIPESVWRMQAAEVFEDYLNSPSSIIKREKNFYKNYPIIDNLYNKYTYDFISSQGEKKLLDVPGKFFDLFWTTNAWSHFSVYFDLDLCFFVAKKVYPKITRSELEDIWHRATDMKAESFDKEQKRDILNYLIKNGNDEKLIEHGQYFLTTYRHAESLEKVELEIKKTYGNFLVNPNLAAAEIKKMDAEKKAKEIAFKIWRANLSSKQKRIADFCQIVMTVRDKRKNHFSKGITIAWRIAEKLFTNAKVDKSLIEQVLVFDELSRGSRYIAAIESELKKRKNGYVLYTPYVGKQKLIYSKIAQEHSFMEKYLIAESEAQTKEIKGQIGNKGITKGRIRIITAASQFHLFQKDEILVTGMTRPEYVSLMRKAKAIITDEGGITCHAAIVSRELNKPCIIGTRFATRILKNGDLVEVDANKGIVRILN